MQPNAVGPLFFTRFSRSELIRQVCMRQKVLLQMWEDWNTCRCPYFPNNFAQNPLEVETPPEIANGRVGLLLCPLRNAGQQRVERLMQVPEEARREQTRIENAEHLRKQSLAREREEARKNSQARRELDGRRQRRRQGRGGAGGGNLRR